MSIRAEEIEGFLSAHERMPTGASFSDGEMFGDWRVTAFLGKGGGGEVYRAVHVTLGMVAALKVYVPRADGDVAREEAARTRFVRETAFLAKNAHSAFPRFLGSGERDGRPWYAMELLESRDLPSRDGDVAKFLLCVADGVRHLHSLGFVHRDIKPSNILWRSVGARVPRDCDNRRPVGSRVPRDRVPVLADLGLIKDVTTSDARLPTSGVTIGGVGTPRYAAPEQLNGDEITPAVDVYALGMLANECFGGKPPKPWARIIRRATTAIPAQRYPSVLNLIRAIRHRHLVRTVLCMGVICALFAISVLIAPGVVARVPRARDGRAVAPRPPQPSMTLPPSAPWGALATSVMSNGMVYSTINLHSNNHEFAELIDLKGPQLVTLHGPGSLVAPVSGPSNVTIRVVNCEFNNTTRVSYPQNAIGYVLEGADTDLLFSNQYYPTNRVRGALITGPNFSSDPPEAKMLFRR